MHHAGDIEIVIPKRFAAAWTLKQTTVVADWGPPVGRNRNMWPQRLVLLICAIFHPADSIAGTVSTSSQAGPLLWRGRWHCFPRLKPTRLFQWGYPNDCLFNPENDEPWDLGFPNSGQCWLPQVGRFRWRLGKLRDGHDEISVRLVGFWGKYSMAAISYFIVSPRIPSWLFVFHNFSCISIFIEIWWILCVRDWCPMSPIQSPDTSPLPGIHAPPPPPRRPNSELLTITSDTLPICHPWAL